MRALAAAGLDERQAAYMPPHGAITWASENDKRGFFELTALSKGARAAIDQ